MRKIKFVVVVKFLQEADIDGQNVPTLTTFEPSATLLNNSISSHLGTALPVLS